MKERQRGFARQIGRLIFTVGLLAALFCVTGICAFADTETVKYDVTYGQTEARSMLSLINEFRTGEDAWYWNSTDTEKVDLTGKLGELIYDYDLEAIAMQRAAEIAISFSHTRPDGTSCFTASSNGVRSYGENIAAGYRSASSVFVGWQETDDNYSDQGHRRNMLSSDYTSVGIGHVYANGVHYWVQEFGYTTATSATAANDSQTKVSVGIDPDRFSISVTASDMTMEYGATAAVPALSVKVAGTEVEAAYTWSVDDSYYLDLTDGILTARQVGSATITASCLGQTKSVNVTITPISISGASVTLGTVDTYTGSEVCPAVSVKLNGKTLAEGSDYEVSYANNSAPGTASVTIEGTGAYSGTVTKNYTIVCEHVYQKDEEVEADCLTDRVQYYTCIYCGDSYGETIAAIGHHTYELIESEEATCGSDGYKAYECTVCGDSYEESIAATGKHTYERIEIGTEEAGSSCVTDKYKFYECSVCGDSYEERIPAKGHTYKLVGTNNATCVEDGYKVYECSLCGDSYTESIPVTGKHTYKLAYTEEAACETDGYKIYECSVCGDSYTESIPATGKHTYELEWTEDATCVGEGAKHYRCSVCGDSYEESIPATGKHSYYCNRTDEANCLSEGKKYYKCDYCEAVYTVTIPKTNDHSYYLYSVNPADCSNEGQKTFLCSVCGDQYTEMVPATGKHTYGKPTFKWSSTGKSATAVFTCTSAGETKSVKAKVSQTSKTTSTIKYKATVTLNGKSYSAAKAVKRTTIGKGESFTSGSLKYKVTSVSGKNGSAAVIGAKKTDITSIKIPDTVKVNGVTLKVTSVSDSAFKNLKKLKTVTAGANVTKIGANAFSGCTALTTFKSTAAKLTTIGSKAFYGCKKLSAVTLKTTKLTKKNVGTNAFKGIKSTCTFKVPKAKLSAYKAIFKAKGAGSKFKVKSL